LLIYEVYFDKTVNVHFSTFFAWITLVVEVFAEIYVNGSRARRLGLTRTISDAAGASVLREREEVLVEDGSARYGTSLPLEGLRPGAYVLRVEAVEDESGVRVGLRMRSASSGK